LTYTTTPIKLTDAIERLLWPLKKIHVPIHEFAMMMTIALRFIPTLSDETDKIMSAQKARGAGFDNGGLIKRAKALVPVLIPLFVSSFRRADELATAMECRCYRGDKNRTKLVKLEFRARDYFWFFIFAIFIAGVVCLSVLPYRAELDSLIFKILFYKI
jgi:energy-coupling factor transport system permease protein